jgi:hypothetical protein
MFGSQGIEASINAQLAESGLVIQSSGIDAAALVRTESQLIAAAAMLEAARQGLMLPARSGRSTLTRNDDGRGRHRGQGQASGPSLEGMRQDWPGRRFVFWGSLRRLLQRACQRDRRRFDQGRHSAAPGQPGNTQPICETAAIIESSPQVGHVECHQLFRRTRELHLGLFQQFPSLAHQCLAVLAIAAPGLRSSMHHAQGSGQPPPPVREKFPEFSASSQGHHRASAPPRWCRHGPSWRAARSPAPTRRHAQRTRPQVA